MRWSKLDAGLHAALDDDIVDDDQELSVFVRSHDGAVPELEETWGATRVGNTLYSMSVRAGAVGPLSDEPWVERISLSRQVRPTGPASAASMAEDWSEGPSLRLPPPAGNLRRASPEG